MANTNNMSLKTPLCDAHAHLGDDAETRARRAQGVRTALCGTDPESAGAVEAACAREALFTAHYGLHPWKTARFAVREMEPWLAKCRVIGEIGLDSVWCDVPARDQRAAFVRQLDIAREMGKRVLLHTKGCEEEIARLVAERNVPCVVHWYSCAEHLERYLDLDSYFTLGPDIAVNPAVREVARRAPRGRVLFETDGLSAVEWAQGRSVRAQDVGPVLEAALREAAAIRGEAPETLRREAAQAYAALYAQTFAEE
ncbi:MAG TPA: TatD family hydrolase [Candidatus Pullichristensenella avicola]|nr:TatD family hydrolase [Candidatus Pullichristensenella avicola]